jgi:xylan 1,4-beta-xylosidase
VWKDLGSPQDPTPHELDAIRARQGLEQLEEPRELAPTAGAVGIQLELPLESVSLVILTPSK